MTYIDAVTFGIALVGATLGVLNFLIEPSRTRVRLKVIPIRCYQVLPETWLGGTEAEPKFEAKIEAPSRPFRWEIRVINLSEFPVGISQIGFGKPWGNPSGDRSIVIEPATSSGRKLPVRLESRQSETFYVAEGQPLSAHAIANPIAWATTDCGVTRTGSSPILVSEAARLSRSI